MQFTSAFSSLSVLSLTLIALFLGLPPQSSLVLGAPAPTHINTNAQTHAPSSQSHPQSPSATHAPSLDDELALVIDVPAAPSGASASDADHSRFSAPVPQISFGAADAAADDDVDTGSESSLVLVGGEEPSSTALESRFSAQLSRYVARKMSALAGRFERSASGNEALSMSDALDLRFYRWAIHYLEHRAAVSAAGSRPNAARSSRTDPAARRFRRLLSRLNSLARRDPNLVLDENDRQVLHSASSELVQSQRPALPAAASAGVQESAQDESGAAVREASARRPTFRSSMPHPYRDELRCRMLCRAYNLHKCICTRD